MKTKFTIAFVALTLGASGAQAQNAYVDKITQLCKQALTGQITQNKKLEAHYGKTDIPFGQNSYEGSWQGQPLIVETGKQFGTDLCDVRFPEATPDDYSAAIAELKNLYHKDGEIYDQPNSKFGYRGETWDDAEAISNGIIKDLKLGNSPIASIMLQYARKGFQQTAGRKGMIAIVLGR